MGRNEPLNSAVGVLQLTFSADVTKKELLERFDEFLFMTGDMKLVNVHDEEIVLDIHEFEYIKFDEESDY